MPHRCAATVSNNDYVIVLVIVDVDKIGSENITVNENLLVIEAFIGNASKYLNGKARALCEGQGS